MIRNNPILKRLINFTIITLCLCFPVTSVSAVQSNQQDAVYIVQEGDTLGSITLQFGITLDALLSVNQISDPNSVFIGQELIIPGLEGISGILTSQVLPFGSSLIGLSRQYELEEFKLITLNRMTSPSETIAGVKFIIPINVQREQLIPIMTFQNSSSLIEASIQADTSPWILISDNDLSASWDALPGEILYGDLKNEGTFAIFSGIENITFNELPFIQGETIQAEIHAISQSKIIGKFNDLDISFVTEDNQNYYGYLGVHAMMEPGPYPLEITKTSSDGINHTSEQLVLVSAGAYGDEWVNVPDEYLNQNDILEEDTYLLPILSKVSPEKLWEGPFYYPVDEPLVNSTFGQRRNYNNGELFFYHTGMDFAVNAPNLNVYAPANGIVVLAEALTIKGNAILIDHGWGIYSGYWHLSEFNVEVGDLVNQGDIIAQIGNTGRSAGPHLHFEIDITGTPVNPQTWFSQEFPQQTP